MNTAVTVCLVAIGIHMIALPAFVWSLRRRQFRESDEEAYRTIRDEGGISSSPARGPRELTPLLPMTRPRMVFLFGYLITLFVLILASLAYITIVASHVPVAPGVD